MYMYVACTFRCEYIYVYVHRVWVGVYLVTYIHTEIVRVCVHIGVHYWQEGGRCEVVTRMETPSYGSVGWKPLVSVCHVLYYFTIETRETSQRSPICRGVHMYVSTHVHVWVHLHACVWVGLGKLYG